MVEHIRHAISEFMHLVENAAERKADPLSKESSENARRKDSNDLKNSIGTSGTEPVDSVA